jgi:hypothetical protein
MLVRRRKLFRTLGVLALFSVMPSSAIGGEIPNPPDDDEEGGGEGPVVCYDWQQGWRDVAPVTGTPQASDPKVHAVDGSPDPMPTGYEELAPFLQRPVSHNQWRAQLVSESIAHTLPAPPNNRCTGEEEGGGDDPPCDPCAMAQPSEPVRLRRNQFHLV